MEKVWPAIFKVPVREGPPLAITEKATLPLPVPLVPEVIPIQLSLLLAVQGQLLPAVTVTFPLPPAAPNPCWRGSME